MPFLTHTVRMMLGNIVVLIALVALSGCGSRLETTIMSEDIPPKPPATEATQPKAPEPALREEPVVEETMALRTEKQPGVPSIEIPVVPPTPPVLRKEPLVVSPLEELPEAVSAPETKEAAAPVVSEQVEGAPSAPPSQQPEMAPAMPPSAIEPISPTAPFLKPEEVSPPSIAKVVPKTQQPEAAPSVGKEAESPSVPPARQPEMAPAVPPSSIEPIQPTAPFLRPEEVSPPAVAKAVPSTPTQPQQPSEEAPPPASAPSPAPPVAAEAQPTLPPTPAPEPVITEEEISEVPLRDVFFDYDQFVIRSDAIPVLTQNATLLLNHYSDHSIVIEGHCDERGTQAYNLVLGKRRAQAVKEYLEDLGVPSERLEIVSYGKERPFCTEHSLQCWQQNRRAHFVLR